MLSPDVAEFPCIFFSFFGMVSTLLFQLNYYGISNLCYILDSVGDSQKV